MLFQLLCFLTDAVVWTACLTLLTLIRHNSASESPRSVFYIQHFFCHIVGFQPLLYHSQFIHMQGLFAISKQFSFINRPCPWQTNSCGTPSPQSTCDWVSTCLEITEHVFPIWQYKYRSGWLWEQQHWHMHEFTCL